MPGLYTEADYENSVIELFRNMGYSYLYGPDIERDFHNPLYEEELVASLNRLNRSLPEDAISDALFKLQNFENGELVQKNTVFMDYLQNGIPVRYFEKGEERSSIHRKQQQTPGYSTFPEWHSGRYCRTEISVQRRNRCFCCIPAASQLHEGNPLHVHL